MWFNTFSLGLKHCDFWGLLRHDRLSWAVRLWFFLGSWSGHEVVLDQVQESLVLVQDVQVSQSGIDECSSQVLVLVQVNWDLFGFGDFLGSHDLLQ